MKEILINSVRDEDMLLGFKENLKGSLQEQWGERVVTFDNELGKGIIRSMEFDWGVSLFDLDLTFFDDIKLTVKSKGVSPLEFIFISKGGLTYKEGHLGEKLELEQFQNIIISPERFQEKNFIFPSNKELKVNMIRIFKKEYLKKKNNNVSHLNELLLSVFKDEKNIIPYSHGGSYSLKIANEVKQLDNVHESGIMRTLSIEGRIYLILSLQLLEHHNFETKECAMESLSKEDIKKINTLSEYIIDNISGTISIEVLSRKSGLTPKKLQLGFKLLYSKTVNEYIRQLKLEVSKDYLKNSDLTVSEIVYLVGIKSRSYFSKIFQESYGILPTDYRKYLKTGKID
ncbi:MULTISPECIES: AraC family transcriptional regulator [Maribacter]|uniref:Helix-turn-helix transcriptional regulator n=1 Tax=Maribacter flavus TaxID=1658664 RepID=A0A5B2TZS1_9FLAO|nr:MULTISPECIES: response regulator transcription factor [Maribacter]KAA2219839.1 helix-turn-helix transcriptional regulator [Maribacter flavus]MDC6405244.1 helix-turn-helix transcriptional regulator [Maribacter sp. PR66]MEE1971947.1 helix-turn-helix transcriptional regulator [Maribacter flavus]